MKIICQGKETKLRTDKADNDMIIISGRSGSGKTTGMQYLLQEQVQKRACSLILGTEINLDWIEELSAEDCLQKILGDEKLYFHSYQWNKEAGITDVLNTGFGITSKSKRLVVSRAVNKAVQQAKEKKREWLDPDDIVQEIMEIESADQKIIDQMLEFFSDVNICFALNDQVGKMTIFDKYIWQVNAGMLSIADRGILYELMLAELFLYKEHSGQSTRPVRVFIDEFQNYFRDNSSVFGRYLTEGRKYELGMCLATQYLESRFRGNKRDMLDQAAIKLTFRSGEEDAKAFSRNRSDSKELRNVLMNLKKGEFMIFGPSSLGENSIVCEGPRKVKLILDESSEQWE